MKVNRQGLISRIAMLVILAEVIIFGSLGWFYVNSFSNSIDERIHRRLEVVGKMIANQELQISIISQKSILSDLIGEQYLDGMVIGGNQRVIVSTNSEDLGRLCTSLPGFNKEWISSKITETSFIHGKNTLTAVLRIRAPMDASPLYTTVITISTDKLNSQKNSIILWGQLGSFFFILLSAAIIIYITQRLITRRVNESLNILKQVEEGDLDARISVTTNDELGILQNGINSMTEKLSELINQHRENEAELRKQKELQTSIIEHAPVRVFWKDLESRYIGCNSLFAKDAGMASVEEVIGKTDDDLGWGSELANRYRSDDQSVMESRESRVEFEEPISTPDGSKSWVSTSKVPLINEDDEVIGILGIYTDITERKALELERQQRENELYQHRENLEKLVQLRTEELSTALHAAEKANKAKSEFLSSMSHELRTPMNAIIGFAQLLLLDDTFKSRDKENISEILKAGNHLLELINQVLDLARVESGKLDMSIEHVHVDEVINESVSLMSNLAKAQEINIVTGHLDSYVVNADFTRLKQAILNLLSNAIKYNRKGGSVEIEVQPQGLDYLRIMVTDTGPGIPNDKLADLFQPFNRLDAQNTNIEGTGIGLTITRHIVQMMGGSVSVESEVGKGSTFWIELPLVKAGNIINTIQEIPNNGDKSTTETATAEQTVLYIEDNISNMNLVSQILGRRHNTHLLTANTPELGIELAKCHIPDLILLDINLPGMDGFQVMEVFKSDTILKQIPVVAVTANAMEADIDKGIAAGFRDYITKPINIEKFNQTLDQIFGNPLLNTNK